MLKKFFSFSRKERNGIIVLISIIIVLIIIPEIYPYIKKDNIVEYQGMKDEIIAFMDNLEDKPKKYKTIKSEKKYNKKTKPKFIGFNFNPNTLDSTGWIKLGFSPAQVRSILNYRNKANGFKSKNDLKKVYVISDSKFERLVPFINIPAIEKNSLIKESKSAKEIQIIVELNRADTAQLKLIKGIGSSYAKRIVKYRNLLGGFIAKEQLMDVYGIDQEKYNSLKAQICIDTTFVSTININVSEEKFIKRHPYLGKEKAKKIRDYKKVMGYIQNLDELIENKIFTEKEANKVKAYLVFD